MNTFSGSTFDCNKEMVVSKPKPNSRLLVTTKTNNKIIRLQSMMATQADNLHIVWVLYCEVWCLIRDQRD